MTLEEYIAARLAYLKAKNVQDFYDRKSPILVPWALRKMTDAERELMTKELELILESIKLMQQVITQAVASSGELDINKFLQENQLCKSTIDNLCRAVIEQYKLQSNLDSGIVCTGGNCIYNATAGLHQAASNEAIVADSRKYGLKAVDRNPQFGDIVILLDLKTKRPFHGIQATNNGFNWSSEGVTAGDLVKDGNFPILKYPHIVYDFVGTAADSALFKSDYEKGIPVPTVLIKPIRQTHEVKSENGESEIDATIDSLINQAVDAGISNRLPSYLLMDYQSVANLKFGGRLNYLSLFKNGGKSKIHIKKSHKGKFTDYCGGKVTEECIRKGKNSSSASVRKQATFAENARHWKH